VRVLRREIEPGRLPREVLVLAVIAFAVAVGFGIVAPVIPLFAREFGVGAAAAGAVVSVFALMRLVSGLGCGRLVDQLGERRVLAAGLAVVAVSSLLAGLAQSYEQLLLLRGAGGVGSAMFTVSAFALMYRVVSADQRGRASGAMHGGFLLGGVAGPAFGGALAEVSLRAPFFVYAGTLTVATLITLVALPAPAPRHRSVTRRPGDLDGPGTQPSAWADVRAALASPAYRAALVVNLGTGWTLFGIRSSLVPLFVADVLGREARWVGIGFVVSAVVQGALLWPAGRFVDAVGRRPGMVLGSLVAAGSILLLAAVPTLPAYLVAMAVYGAAASVLGVAPAAVVGDVADGRGGTVVAVSQMASDVGAIVGPLLAGVLAQQVSFGAAFVVTAAVVAAGAILSARMPETGPRSVEDAPSARAT